MGRNARRRKLAKLDGKVRMKRSGRRDIGFWHPKLQRPPREVKVWSLAELRVALGQAFEAGK